MLSRKNLTLFSLVFSLIFGSGLVYSYIQIYQPMIKDIMKLKTSITTVKNEVSTLDASKKVDTAEIVTNTSTLQKKLPVAELSDQFVLLLEKVEVASGSRIMSIAFNKGDNTEAANTTAEENIAAAEKANQDAQKAMDLTADKNTETTTLPAGVKKLTVTLSVESPSYVELEAFIKELEELPRITKVESLSFSGVAEGDTSNVLTYSVVASTYYYPDLTDLKNQLPDYETPAPSKKTNPLYEAEEVTVEVPQTDSETKVDPTNGTTNTQADDISSTDNQNDTKVIKKNGKPYKVTSYQVQPGDTFFELAVKFYNNNKGIELIKSWNQITELQSGVTIEIPIPVDGEI